MQNITFRWRIKACFESNSRRRGKSGDQTIENSTSDHEDEGRLELMRDEMYIYFFFSRTETFSEDSNSLNFDKGDLSESEFKPMPLKANTSKRISLSHTVFAVFRTGI